MSDRTKGVTDQSLLFRLTDSTTGSAKSGIDVTTLRLQYARPGEAPGTATSLTQLASLSSAWTPYAGREVDVIYSKGLYRIDCPNAAFATGASEVSLTISGTGLESSTRLIDLVTVDSRIVGGKAPVTLASTDVTGNLPVVLAAVTHTGAVIPKVTLVDTITTYTGNTPQTGDSYARIGTAGAGLSNVSLGASGLDAVDVILSPMGLDQIEIEAGINVRQALSPILAVSAGVVSGAATTNIIISAANHSATNRIAATVDSSGNRSAVSLNLPS
jgi:hypothetical protein